MFLGKHTGLCHPACVLQITAKDETERTPAEFLSLPSNIQGPHTIMFPTMSLLHFSHGCPQFSVALRGWCARSQSCHQYYIVLCKSALPIILMLCDAMRLCPLQHLILTFPSSYCSTDSSCSRDSRLKWSTDPFLELFSLHFSAF